MQKDNIIEEMMAHNRQFVAQKAYEQFRCSKFPRKQIAIVTCMDTRLVTLLPAALGIANGDVKMIKNAGGLIDNPLDSCMRSILVAIYELGVNHIMIIAHTNCGVQGMDGHHFIEIMKHRGIPAQRIATLENCGIDLEKWLTGFNDTAEAVRRSVNLVANHPLIPADVKVSGFIIDTETGALTPVE